MRTETPIRILVADDHKLFRSGIISLLTGERNIYIIGEAESGKELIEKYEKLLPDIILADISMPSISGLSAVKEIVKKYPDAKALFLSMYDDEEYIYQTYKAGGSGLISKNVMKDELLFAINEVFSGKKYFGKSLSNEALKGILHKYENFNKNDEDKKIDQVTDQERKVLLLIAEGFTSPEIAEKLEISKRTVDTHRRNLIKKLKLNSLTELMKFAFKYSTELK